MRIATLFLVPVLILSLNSRIVGQDFQASLSGNNQPLPVVSQASGLINATINGDTLTVEGSFDNILSGVDTSIVGGAHIHAGLAGQNGGVVIPLKPTLSEGLNSGMFEVASNTFILDPEVKAAAAERGLYINIHSNDYGAGEIRGQLLPAADEVYSANLFGSNQVPSVMSNGQGTVMLELTGSEVVVSGSISNLSSAIATEIIGGAHIHMAMAGRNGGVVEPLTLQLSDDSTSAEIRAGDNTFMWADSIIEALQSEALYVNIHTRNWTGGELRGQLTPLADVKFRTYLSGANQSPAVQSFAGGKLVYGLRDGILTVSGTFRGLESDLNEDILGGGHIHLGMAGRNGPVAFPLQLTVNDDKRGALVDPANNRFLVGGDTLMALLGRALYVNIHSLDYSGGEIRGQILPESQYFLQGDLRGSQMVPSVESMGSGSAIIEVLGGNITVTGSFENLSSPLLVSLDNGAHIHFAPAGRMGPHLINLVTTPDDDIASGRFRALDNKFSVSPTRRDSLRGRWGYISVHSEDVMTGELRGQLVHEAAAYYYAPLSGAEEVPAVVSDGSGAAIMEYNGQSAIITGSFTGLGSPVNTNILGGGHVHTAFAGSNGGVAFPLALSLGDGDTSGTMAVPANVFPVTTAFMDTVRNRGTYVNIHSLNEGGGELRGNFRPIAMSYYLANLRGKNSTVPMPSTGVGSMIFERNSNHLVASGSFNNLIGDFDKSIAGGAHVHFGSVGTNGGIGLFLSSVESADLKAAVFLADSNSFDLPDSTRMSLMGGNTYVNVHSTTQPGGEIRGQVLHEINHAPTPTSFTSPESGDTITIGGDLSQPFTVTWNESSDPNGDAIRYLWQLSLTSDFAAPAITVATDSATQFSTTFGLVDTLLATLGIDSGEAVTVYHRVTASDGSLCGVHSIDSVILIKGISTSIQENPYLEDVFVLYPNPAKEQVQLEFVMKQNAMGLLRILDYTGKMVMEQRSSLFAGDNKMLLNIGSLPSGTYVARLIVNQEVAVAKLFTKE